MRLPAEFIRDQALAVSGLLDDADRRAERVALPAGRACGKRWPSGDGKLAADVHARATATTCIAARCTRSGSAPSPPPTLITFDAPDRETCTVRRSRTNTPLQALVLLNDPTYVEARASWPSG